MRNILGYKIKKPNQELIIMSGIPGCGKSTKAKELAGKNGTIHSTDDVISSKYDYYEFFKKINFENDYRVLSKMHNENFNNALKSLKKGNSPVIIDNTNIKLNDSKSIVVESLKLGLDEKNIKFIDLGTSGLSAEELFKRNKHGVSIEKINSMIQSHKSRGNLTLEKVLNSKDQKYVYKKYNIFQKLLFKFF